MPEPIESEFVEAVGVALAVVASLIERETPIPKGEVGRCLALMAAASDKPRQREVLASWGELLGSMTAPNRR